MTTLTTEASYTFNLLARTYQITRNRIVEDWNFQQLPSSTYSFISSARLQYLPVPCWYLVSAFLVEHLPQFCNIYNEGTLLACTEGRSLLVVSACHLPL